MVGVFSVDYTVERGDTLGKIAQEHGVSVADLVEANDISNPNLIRIGQVLVIPGEEGEPDITHVVVRGDTLGHIAAKYGSTVSVLVQANGIANANLIRPGQNILIPGGGQTGSGSTSGGSTSASTDQSVSSNPSVRSGAFHVVQRGQKLDTIAANYNGVSAEQIARANGIIDGRVFTGTRLFLDGPDFVGEGGEGESIYTIQRGDRLGDIAAAHDTTISKLAKANDISNVNLIRAGQDLIVPKGAAWVCPVDGAWFFNDWGFPRGGGTRYHEGNDLFASLGAPVRAPVSGVVGFKTGGIGGMQFNLTGDDGVEYIGSHMSGFGKEGRVQAGDIVGYVGTSGNAMGTKPHLHFGMYLKGGVVINPYPSLIANGCK
jgi:LysM repeat protein